MSDEESNRLGHACARNILSQGWTMIGYNTAWPADCIIPNMIAPLCIITVSCWLHWNISFWEPQHLYSHKNLDIVRAKDTRFYPYPRWRTISILSTRPHLVRCIWSVVTLLRVPSRCTSRQFQVKPAFTKRNHSAPSQFDFSWWFLQTICNSSWNFTIAVPKTKNH